MADIIVRLTKKFPIVARLNTSFPITVRMITAESVSTEAPGKFTIEGTAGPRIYNFGQTFKAKSVNVSINGITYYEGIHWDANDDLDGIVFRFDLSPDDSGEAKYVVVA